MCEYHDITLAADGSAPAFGLSPTRVTAMARSADGRDVIQVVVTDFTAFVTRGAKHKGLLKVMLRALETLGFIQTNTSIVLCGRHMEYCFQHQKRNGLA